MSDLPIADLDDVICALGDTLLELRGSSVLVTGATGFFGVWLVSALLHASERMGLDLRVHVLSRSPERFVARAPRFRDSPALSLLAGDIRTFCPKPGPRFTHVVHAATAASAALNASNPIEMASVAAEGTRHLLGIAHDFGAERVLFTSSGAVYGKQPPNVSHVHEDQMGGIDPLATSNAYAEGKRLAELYCAAFQQQHGLSVVVARCFAFVGPYLPLDAHFAIGNFIQDALEGRPIVVSGDGTTRRSYLYATDLTVWLLTLLLRGTPGRAYNVGSEHDLSMAELARLVGEQARVPVEIRGKRDPSRPIDLYVPSTERIRSELQVKETVSLDESVRRTLRWYGPRVG